MCGFDFLRARTPCEHGVYVNASDRVFCRFCRPAEAEVQDAARARCEVMDDDQRRARDAARARPVKPKIEYTGAVIKCECGEPYRNDAYKGPRRCQNCFARNPFAVRTVPWRDHLHTTRKHRDAIEGRYYHISNHC